MLSRQSVGTYQGNELTHSSSLNTRHQSSQLAEPPGTDPGLEGLRWCARADLHLLKKKSAGGECGVSRCGLVVRH